MSFNPDFQQAEPFHAAITDDAEAFPLAPAQPGSSPFLKSLLFGIVGAVAGALVYAGFIYVTHINIGYLAIGVAFLIAKAMTAGSQGQGGRRYQVTAVLLTYLSIGAADVLLTVWRSSDGLPHSVLACIIISLLSVIAPFLRLADSIPGGLIDLFILFIGMRAAWRMTSGDPGAAQHPFAR